MKNNEILLDKNKCVYLLNILSHFYSIAEMNIWENVCFLNVNPCQEYGQGLFGDMSCVNLYRHGEMLYNFTDSQIKTGVGRNKKKKEFFYFTNKVIVRETFVIYCFSVIILYKLQSNHRHTYLRH